MSAIADEMANLAVFFSERKIAVKGLKGKTRLFIDAFSGLKDSRFKPYTKYSLESLLGICFVMAIMGKFTSFYGVEQYVKLKPALFVKLGLVEKGKYPSNDTYLRAFRHLDASEFASTVIGRIRRFYDKVAERSKAEGRRMISGDGQCVRGTGRAKAGGSPAKPINVMNIYDVSRGVVLFSKPVDDKTNEIPVFQSMLRKFDIRGAIVTADALHCQRETVGTIVSKKADYCFAAKSNQPSLVEAIDAIFASRAPDCEFSYCGRDYRIVKLADHEIAPEWEGARCVIKTVSHKREAREGKPGEEMRFVTSLRDEGEIREAIQMRWEIENGLHRFKDVQLCEDRIRVRDRNALRNMCAMNNVVYSLYRIAASLLGVTPQQAKIIYEDNPIGMLAEICPLMVGNNFTMLVKRNMRGTKESKRG